MVGREGRAAAGGAEAHGSAAAAAGGAATRGGAAAGHDVTVVRTLAHKQGSLTELVLWDGDLCVRKTCAIELASQDAWMALAHIDAPLIPEVRYVGIRGDEGGRDDELVVVTSYVEGQSLADRVDTRGPVGVEEAVAIMGDLCLAASALHAQGIIHRDITPGNVILAADGAHLIDLGIARVRKGEARHDTLVFGTLGYAAPEQFGFAETDPRSDVFSLGSVLGYMLTGIAPDDEGFHDALASTQRVPASLRAVVGRARAFEPSQRYQSADGLMEALRRAIAGGGGARDVGGTRRGGGMRMSAASGAWAAVRARARAAGRAFLEASTLGKVLCCALVFYASLAVYGSTLAGLQPEGAGHQPVYFIAMWIAYAPKLVLPSLQLAQLAIGDGSFSHAIRPRRADRIRHLLVLFLVDAIVVAMLLLVSVILTTPVG